ncbi:hypothetical protein [Streptomyces sp. Sce081]|uniref:hypothetical protein n=1 Tax=Streptomyces sp. Sce081 TaxID=3349853 RepID=UPI0035F4F783
MTLLPVFVGLVVGWVALRGLPAHPLLPLWVRTSVFWTVPLGALTWVVIMVADDPFLFPETDPCPGEPLREGVLGSGEVPVSLARTRIRCLTCGIAARMRLLQPASCGTYGNLPQ